MSQGKVYLVGAGPGDAELITLKGYRLICRADVILHDRLIPAELLRLAKPAAEIISVGKFAGRHPVKQSQINALLVEKAADNKIVVRLKGGDPYLFGRGGEEAEACADAGVDVEVVPGVSSALAAACYAGIPPTHRDYTSNIAIVTGHRKDEKEVEIPRAGTVIFLMSVANIRKIISSLIKAGWPSETKIAAIENGCCYNQRLLTGTLADFSETVEREKLTGPAIFIVGRVVELHQKLDWFAGKPRILVVGTHSEKYAHLGTIVHRPLIKLVALEDYTQADRVLKSLDIFDWLIFTSSHGVKFFFERLNSVGLDARALGPAKVAAIGATTAEKLGSFGISADVQPVVESSAGLLEEFSKIKVKGKSILIVRSEAAGAELTDGFAAAGAVVETAAVYRNIEIEPGEIDFDFIDQILFTSGSTVQAFLNRYGAIPGGVKVFCLGVPTLSEARKNNIQAELLPGREA